ncbi:MAG: biotin/lipoyl-containing protein [Archaeoglobaceae archaeon]
MIYKVEVGGKIYEVEVEEVGANLYQVKVNGKTALIEVRPKIEVKTISIETPSEKIAEKVVKAEKVEGKVIKAPMNGIVTKIFVKVGDEIKEGDIVAVIEAMKMENPIKASISGKVVEILVKVGDKVLKDSPIIRLG